MEKVKFKQLGFWMKAGIIGGIFSITYEVLGFIWGFIFGFKAVI